MEDYINNRSRNYSSNHHSINGIKPFQRYLLKAGNILKYTLLYSLVTFATVILTPQTFLEHARSSAYDAISQTNGFIITAAPNASAVLSEAADWSRIAAVSFEDTLRSLRRAAQDLLAAAQKFTEKSVSWFRGLLAKTPLPPARGPAVTEMEPQTVPKPFALEKSEGAEEPAAVREVVECREVAVPLDISSLRNQVLSQAVSLQNAFEARIESSIQNLRLAFSSLNQTGTAASNRMIAISQKIDDLSSVKLSNVSVAGVSGLTDSDVPDGITVTGPQTLTDLTASTFNITSTSATSSLSTGGFTVGTNQFVVQQTSGNVGIGTATPDFPLMVAGDITTTHNDPDLFLRNTTTAYSTNVFIGGVDHRRAQYFR